MGIRKHLMAAFVAATVVAAPAQLRAESLAAALADAYRSSGLLEQNRALLRAADEDVAQAVAALRPILNWRASATISDPRETVVTPSGLEEDLVETTIGLSMELLLYDFGRSDFAIAAQKELVLATRQQLVSVEQDVLLRGVEAYLDVRRNLEFVALRRNNVRVITEQLRAAEDRFEVGEVTRTDVALAEARLAEARSALAAAEGNLAQAVAEFRAAVGRPPGDLRPVSPAPLDRGLDAAVAFALRNHPDILAAQRNVAAADLNVAVARAQQRPRVTLDGSYTLSDSGTVTEFVDREQIGVTISGPIARGGALASQVRQAMARRDSQRAQLHLARDRIMQRVANAYAQVEVARARTVASDEQVRAAQVAFRGVREEATLGARTTLDVLDAEQELLDARANGISARIDEALASYAVLAAMGLLTADNLGLGVQTYDPSAYYRLVDDAPLGLSDRGRALDRVLRAIGD